LSPEVTNFLFETVNVLLLAGGLAWLFFRPLRDVLKAEQDRHNAQEKDLVQRHEQAEQALAEATEKRHEAEQQLDAERAQVLEAARRQADSLLEDAKTAVERDRRRQLQHLAAERRAMTQNAVKDIARIAAASVQGLLLQTGGPALQRALVQAACERLRQLPSPLVGNVTVESARQLDEESLAALRSVLATSPTERVLSDLGVGIRVTTQVGQVDVSALGMARAAADQLSSALEPTIATGTLKDE
jgi:F-type H+-transporting ATPase subunit b